MTNPHLDSAAGGIAPLPGWFIALRRAVDGVTGALNVAGTLLIVAVMLLVNADVIGRGVLSAPVSGVPEMVSMSIVAIVFLQVAQTFRRGRLTRTDLLPGMLERRSPRAREALELVFALAAIALVWQIIRASWPLLEKAWVRGTYEGTIGDFTAPIWPVKAIIVIGCGALLVQLVLHGMAAALRLWRGGAQ
jgi:TRAP-type mannitol/chloroaromatic compound transport system permease small subunit